MLFQFSNFTTADYLKKSNLIIVQKEPLGSLAVSVEKSFLVSEFKVSGRFTTVQKKGALAKLSTEHKSVFEIYADDEFYHRRLKMSVALLVVKISN